MFSLPRTTALAGLLMICLAGEAQAQVVRIPDRVEVREEHLTLGDLCPGVIADLADLSFGYAPYPGQVRWLSRSEVLSALRRAGYDNPQVQMAEKVLVTRASQTLTVGMVKAAVARYFATAYPKFEMDVTELEVPQDIALPAGKLELSVDSTQVPTRLDGVTLKLRVSIDGKTDRSQWVHVRARAHGRVVTTTRPVGFGEVLNRSNLELEDKVVDQLEGLETDVDLVAGSVAKRALQAGDVVTSRDINQPVLVKRGDLVTMVARLKNLTISASARARDSGGRGDLIVVQNLDSRQLVEARIVAPNRVEVVLAGGGR